MSRARDRFGHRLVVLCAGLAASALVVLGGPATADGTASIDHVQPTNDGKVAILMSVPGTDPVDFGSATVTIDGKSVTATAQDAAQSDVQRTSVLAFDTSNSMAGEKFKQAKAAAISYLDAVPGNVSVAVVTFDKQVRVAQAPSQDHNAARNVISHLTLARQTALNQGVMQAVSTVGTKGGRTVLVLSDGEDTTKFPLTGVLKSVKASGAKVDVVALKQSGRGLTSLTKIANAGHGTVLNANDPASLTQTFKDEARSLARQVLVTADVPAANSTDANIEVSIGAGTQIFSRSAYATVRQAVSQRVDKAGNQIAVAAPAPAFAVSDRLMLGGVVAIGLGILGLVLGLAYQSGPKSSPNVLGDQISVYGTAAAGKRRSGVTKKPTQSLSATAKARAGAMLANNKGLEVKIAARLEGAGMSLKPAEWILLHGGIALGTALVFLLISGANVIFLVIGLILGAVFPWVYLGLKRSKRIKAFQSALPDTLQLISGSLSAGLSLAQSVDTIVREGTEPIASEFKRVTIESRLGVNVEDAMEGVAARMESRDFGWVVMAIRIQRDVGGNLAELLLTVAETLREREYIRRHVRALSAEGRLSCYVLGGLPPVFLLYLSLTKWDYVSPLFTTPIGYICDVALLVLLSVGIFWMSKVAKVEL
ncbi:MAG: type II secretion system F family protein [Marmoricola sp.]